MSDAPAPAPASLKRYGSVIGLNAEKLEEYKTLHAAVWPDVLAMIKKCNIQNYSIFLRKLPPDGQYFLFSYFEYTGVDFKADMQAMAADETTQRWWALCKPCQKPLEDRASDEWWANMEEVFHEDWLGGWEMVYFGFFFFLVYNLLVFFYDGLLCVVHNKFKSPFLDFWSFVKNFFLFLKKKILLQTWKASYTKHFHMSLKLLLVHNIFPLKGHLHAGLCRDHYSVHSQERAFNCFLLNWIWQ